MDKMKVAIIVITALSALATLLACAIGLPYTPAEIDYDYVCGDDGGTSVESGAPDRGSEADVTGEGAVRRATGTD